MTNQTILLTGRNPDTVNPNTSLAKAFDVKNGSGQDAYATGIILKYKSGLDRVTLDVKNKKAGAELDLSPTGEGISLGCLGTPFNSKFNQVLKIRPFLIRNNGSIDVALATLGGQTINPMDVDLTLVCETSPQLSKRHTLLIPFRNNAAVAAGFRKPFEVKNGLRNLEVVALITKFTSGLDRIRFEIQNRKSGGAIDLTPNNDVSLGAIGSAFDSTFIHAFKVKPFIFNKGVNVLDLACDSGATPAAVGDVEVIFVCEYEA